MIQLSEIAAAWRWHKTYFKALPPVLHRRLGDRGGARHKRSTENQDIPDPHLSSNILERLLVRDTDGMDGAARSV